MADPVKTAILDDMRTVLATITAGATYSRTVRTVGRVPGGMPSSSLFDIVNIISTGATKTDLSNKTVVTMTVRLEAIVEAADPPAAVDQVEADIEKALMADITRGGRAIDTQIVSCEEAISDHSSLGGTVIEVRIVYRHAPGDPYTGA